MTRSCTIQVGKMVDGAADYHTKSSTRGAKSTLVEELLSDAKSRQYRKKKFNEIQVRQKKGGPTRARVISNKNYAVSRVHTFFFVVRKMKHFMMIDAEI